MAANEVRNEAEARAILNIADDAPLAAWRPAFSVAVKLAHPDHGGGTAEACRVIEAYKFLKDAETRRNRHPRVQQATSSVAEPAPFPITIDEAFRGVERDVLLAPGQSFKVRLPPGLRTGELISFGLGRTLVRTITIRAQPDAEIRGSDLWLTAGISFASLKTGGLVRLRTPTGERHLWLSRRAADDQLITLPNEGLPPRGPYPSGTTFIQLKPEREIKWRPLSIADRRSAM